MDTRSQAIEFVRKKKFSFWKLYKGSIRISQCDIEENPDKSPELAADEFEQEMSTSRPSGAYYVNVYRNSKGDKSGFRLDFNIENSEPSRPTQNFNSRGGMDESMMYKFIESQIKNGLMLESIDKKLTVVLEAIALMSDGDKDNDSDIKKMVMGVIGNVFSKSGKVIAAPTIPTPTIKSGGFNSL